jgi:hypothetical protein
MPALPPWKCLFDSARPLRLTHPRRDRLGRLAASDLASSRRVPPVSGPVNVIFSRPTVHYRIRFSRTPPTEHRRSHRRLIAVRVTPGCPSPRGRRPPWGAPSGLRARRSD